MRGLPRQRKPPRGQGVPRRVDHSDDAQVEDLVQSVWDEFGRIDVLVNNVFCVPEPRSPEEQIFGPFWQTPVWAWNAMHHGPHRKDAGSGALERRRVRPRRQSECAADRSCGGGARGDPQIMRRSGGAFAVANLARDYAFTDVDGTTPEPVDIG